jgi:hypothetical protein
VKTWALRHWHGWMASYWQYRADRALLTRDFDEVGWAGYRKAYHTAQLIKLLRLGKDVEDDAA